jgi:membrane protein DedA with SNARE-associated domain
MDYWKFLVVRAITLLVLIPLFGYALFVLVDLIRNAWKSDNWRKKWVAMMLVAAVYLALNGWFHG